MNQQTKQKHKQTNQEKIDRSRKEKLIKQTNK